MYLSLQNADFASLQKSLAKINGIKNVRRISETDSVLNVRLAYQSTDDLRSDVYRKIKETDWILLEFHQETLMSTCRKIRSWSLLPN